MLSKHRGTETLGFASPGGLATRPAATRARRGLRTMFALDLDANCVAQHQLQFAGMPLGDLVQGHFLDEGDRGSRKHHRGRRPACVTRRAPASRRRLFLQQYWRSEHADAVFDDAGRSSRHEGLLHGRRLRRQHRLAHRERHHRHRRPRYPAARHEGLSRDHGGRRRRRTLPFDWRSQVSEFSKRSTPTRRRRATRSTFRPRATRRWRSTRFSTLSTPRRRTIRPTSMRRTKQFRNWRGILVPMNYTRVPRFRHDPATRSPRRPSRRRPS